MMRWALKHTTSNFLAENIRFMSFGKMNLSILKKRVDKMASQQPRKPTKIISCDLETSGIGDEYSVLSIGLVNPVTLDSLYVEIQWDNLFVNTKAMEINKLSLCGDEKIKPKTAAQKVYDWLHKQGLKKYDLRMLGLNPAFDRRHFENFMINNLQNCPYDKFFIHRCVDLNSIFAFIAHLEDKDPHDVRDAITKEALIYLNSEVTIYVSHLGLHNALYDAAWNVAAFECCRQYMKRKKYD